MRKTSGSNRPPEPEEHAADGEKGAEGGDGAEGAAKGKGRRTRETPQRGTGIAMKFSIAISVLILVISMLFGFVMNSIISKKLDQEIVRSAYAQILHWRWLGRKCYDNFVNAQGAPKAYYESEQGQQDRRELEQVLKNEPRILDIALFKYTSRESAEPILRTKDAKEFSLPKTNSLKKVDLDGQEPDPEVEVWEGKYADQSAVFVRAPVLNLNNGDLKDVKITLILSRQQIESEIGFIRMEIIVFGLLFVGAGVLVSLFVASRVTKPLQHLMQDIDVVANGNLKHETRSETTDEIGTLAAAFNRMTRSLRDARDNERERDRLNSELNMAKDIHATLLPSKLPSIECFDMFTGYYCAKEVGGDYYDFIPVDAQKGLLGIVVADVSGKGIPGSMVMGTTRTILRLMANFDDKLKESPSAVLAHTNYHVARDIKRGMFVTMVYAILNVFTAEMTIASAGHNPTVIWRARTRKCELVRPNGIALGFDKGPIFQRTAKEEKVILEGGDRVVFYTDGVVEAMNEQREEYGDDRFFEWVEANAELPSNEFVRQLKIELDNHKGRAEQHDDITVTTFRLEV